jgi:hypothetical protein
MLSSAAGYIGWGLNSPTSIAIDESGNTCVTDFDTVTELSNIGVALSPSNGFVPGNMLLGSTIAIDAACNAWLPYMGGQLIQSGFDHHVHVPIPRAQGWE